MDQLMHFLHLALTESTSPAQISAWVEVISHNVQDLPNPTPQCCRRQ